MALRAFKTKSGGRNPERTRERILAASLHEFATEGFAGARVDKIARLSGSNKRMLYHYFGNKEGLFRAVLRSKISARTQKVFSQAPSDLASSLPLWFARNCDDIEWMRLLTWESLQATGKKLLDEHERRKQVRLVLARARLEQAEGMLDPKLDPAHLLLAVTSLSMFPHALPHLTRLIIGSDACDPKFQRGYEKFLKKLARIFRPAHTAR